MGKTYDEFEYEFETERYVTDETMAAAYKKYKPSRKHGYRKCLAEAYLNNDEDAIDVFTLLILKQLRMNGKI